MRARAVALVNLKSVARILFSHLQHDVVPGNLGQHGRGGDVGAQAVAPDHRPCRNTEVRFPVAVNQSQIRLAFKLRQCPLHGQKRGLQNIDFIDFLMAGKADAIGDSLRLNEGKQLPAFLVGELFGVVQTGQMEMFGQNYSGGAYRPGKRAAARLVHAADCRIALVKPLVLNFPHGDFAHRSPSGSSSVNRPSFPLRNSSSRTRAIRSVLISPRLSRKPRFRPASVRRS